MTDAQIGDLWQSFVQSAAFALEREAGPEDDLLQDQI